MRIHRWSQTQAPSMRFSNAAHLLRDVVDYRPRHEHAGGVLVQQRHVGRRLAINTKDWIPGVVEGVDHGDHEHLRIQSRQEYRKDQIRAVLYTGQPAASLFRTR